MQRFNDDHCFWIEIDALKVYTKIEGCLRRLFKTIIIYKKFTQGKEVLHMEANQFFEQIKAEIIGKPMALASFSTEDTVLVVVDMVKGFVDEGILSSPRVLGIVQELVELTEKMKAYPKVFFLDIHPEDAVEFKTYAKHCVEGTSEATLVPELVEAVKDHPQVTVIPKNSTNGFHAPAFKEWLKAHESSVKNYIVVGCEADICVSHFATTLRTYFNQTNNEAEIYVYMPGVETFDYGTHVGDYFKALSLWEMQSNGIGLINSLK